MLLISVLGRWPSGMSWPGSLTKLANTRSVRDTISNNNSATSDIDLQPPHTYTHVQTHVCSHTNQQGTQISLPNNKYM